MSFKADVSCQIRFLTDNAALVFNGYDEVWLPRQFITKQEDLEISTNMVVIEIPEWLAIEKELV